jgi:mono/diheme cytochrome c family protein/PAS domain-containing protein
MRVLGALGVGAVLSACLSSDLRPQTESASRENAFQEQIRPVLKQYCAGCHSNRMKTAGVAVDGLGSVDSFRSDGDTWERVLRKVRIGEMPPPGMPRPSPSTVSSFVGFVSGELDRIAEAHPDPGRVTAHRLNRAEYDNAIRDLLGVDFHPAADFPADDSGYGFDNIADVLSLPPVLIEKYLAAAGKVTLLALGQVRFDPVLERFNAPRRQSQNSRAGEGAPVSSRGGMDLEQTFPADAEYLFRVRLRGTPDRSVPEFVDVRLDGKLLQRSETKIGTEEEDEDQRRIEVRAPLTAGRHDVLVTFLRDDSKNESAHLEYRPDGAVDRARLAVDWVEIGGPFNVKDTGRRPPILNCTPRAGKNDEACAREILARVARRAWRRPVTSAEARRLAGFYRLGKQDTGKFEGGLGLGLRAILVSPDFLFRIEHDPTGVKPGEIYPIPSLELASRMSFFLWSSIPDEELLEAAERGDLSKPEVYEKQLRRMMLNSRSSALTSNFAGQWLHLRNLAANKPDPERFPDFDPDLRQTFQREAELFFQAILQEDRSVLEFLDSQFTFANERLAKFYGIPNVEGSRFRRVDLPNGERGGVMTMGAVLAVTSYPTRTSPVIRGKWVLENLLGAPPPPPPPDVPPLQEAGLGKTVSMRQQLEAHRAKASCAGCHAKMDPIGFALEHYDATGQWRAKDGGFDVDSAGKLPSGAAFQDASELKRILREHPEEFVLCFTEKLMTYALGRGVERADKPVIRGIARQAAKDGYRISSIILGIANGAPFRMRTASEPAKVKDPDRQEDVRAGS